MNKYLTVAATGERSDKDIFLQEIEMVQKNKWMSEKEKAITIAKIKKHIKDENINA